MAHVRSTPVTPAGYVDKLNVLAGTGQIGPGGLGTHAWPVEANVFPPVALGEPLAVNNDPEETGQSYEYIVENQFIEVTNKWDSETTYFYFHPLPSGVTQVSVLDSDHDPVTVEYLIEGSRLYHTLEGDVYWVRYFANDRFQEELITSQLVMPRAPRLNKEEAPFVAADHFAWTHGVIDIPSWAEHRFRFYEQPVSNFRFLHNASERPLVRADSLQCEADAGGMDQDAVRTVPALHGRHLGARQEPWRRNY